LAAMVKVFFALKVPLKANRWDVWYLLVAVGLFFVRHHSFGLLWSRRELREWLTPNVRSYGLSWNEIIHLVFTGITNSCRDHKHNVTSSGPKFTGNAHSAIINLRVNSAFFKLYEASARNPLSLC